MGMRKNTHQSVVVHVDTWKELMRIKYARGFNTVDEVIRDLLDDDDLVMQNVE